MKNLKKLFVSATALVMAVCLTVGMAGCGKTTKQENAEYAVSFLQTINSSFSKRQAGTASEQHIAEYINKEFTAMGYEPTVQPFTYTRKEVEYNSQNVIATKKSKVESAKTIIVGAHMDSASAGNGIDDNASGVAVMLAAAKYYAKNNSNYNITFIAFGAEEVGCKGSNFYAKSLSAEQVAATYAMYNLDTLAAGDFVYVYAGTDEVSLSLLKNALDYSEEEKLGFKTNEGLNPEYPLGTTGDWSDHAAFKKLNIPFIYYESTNWTIGEKTGETQIDGAINDYEIMHSAQDNLDFISTMFPGRIEEHMKVFTDNLIFMLK